MKKSLGLGKVSGFTLLELLIIVALIACLAVVAIYLINPKKQIERGWDARRKSDLATTKKILEDFYNDKNRYPLPSEICYDGATPVGDGSFYCHICGDRSSPPSLLPYSQRLLCDPQDSTHSYLYHIENNSNPNWYLIYTKFSDEGNKEISETGCQDGCGVGSNPTSYIYNYCIGSPNANCNPYVGLFCDNFGTLYEQMSGSCNNCTIPCKAQTIFTKRVNSICTELCKYK